VRVDRWDLGFVIVLDLLDIQRSRCMAQKALILVSITVSIYVHASVPLLHTANKGGFLGAATDTIVVTLSTIMLIFVAHPEVLRKARNEVDRVCADRGGVLQAPIS